MKSLNMKTSTSLAILICIILSTLPGCSPKELNNVFYVQNTLEGFINAPKTPQEKARLIKSIGFDGLEGFGYKDYFALKDALAKTQDGYSRGGLAVKQANDEGYDRIIVLTDGEWHVMDGGTGKAQNVSPAPLKDKAYMINVANTQYGVGYGKWTSIDGWSESVIDYIREFEMLTD